jgi:uncharacterized protein YqhQ
MLGDRPYPNKVVLLLIVGFFVVVLFFFFIFIVSTIIKIIRIVASWSRAWATSTGGTEDEALVAKACD